jgi:hypothetical protein
MSDIFKPRSEPAKTLYEAFQEESKNRKGRESEEWIFTERMAVWRAAMHYAQQHGLRVPSIEEVENAERYASGSVDYGAKWAYRVAGLMEPR